MLKVGDRIKTSLSEDTVVLDLDPKQQEAILMADSTFVLAHNLTKEKDGTYSWQAGQYEKSMEEILSVKNPRLPSSPKQTLEEDELDFDQMKQLLRDLMQNNYRSFVKALISIEKQVEDPEVLENAYEAYMDKDPVELINPKLLELSLEENNYKEPDIDDFFNNTSMKI